MLNVKSIMLILRDIEHVKIAIVVCGLCKIVFIVELGDDVNIYRETCPEVCFVTMTVTVSFRGSMTRETCTHKSKLKTPGICERLTAIALYLLVILTVVTMLISTIQLSIIFCDDRMQYYS